jgi:hypothetical protein
MTNILNYSGRLTVEVCWCGMRHAVPEELSEMQERQHRNGETQIGIYCPLGHQHIFSGKGEAERLRGQLERARLREQRVSDQLQASERSNAALKGVVTKTKKRVGKGVCPCCNRHFENVERHMQSKHPGFSESPT